MNTVKERLQTHLTTKEMIIRDFKRSGKDLGGYAIDNLKLYDDISYQLVVVNATSKGKPITGSAIMDDMTRMKLLIKEYRIQGEYYIRVIDTQKEFFILLAEIRDDI
jgi:hypothetical protein